MVMNGSVMTTKKERLANKEKNKMKVTYEIENGKNVKVMTDTYWVKKFDENGNKIYFNDNNGYEEWYEYDANNNMVHEKCSNGFECWYEYDSNNHKIYFKNNSGWEKWWEYDSKGNEIHFKDNDGYEEWYNSKGNCIHIRNDEGEEWFAKGYKKRRVC